MARKTKNVETQVETQVLPEFEDKSNVDSSYDPLQDWVAQDDFESVPKQEDEEYFVPEFAEKQDSNDNEVQNELIGELEDEEYFVPEFPEEKPEQEYNVLDDTEFEDPRDAQVDDHKPAPEHLEELKEEDYLEKCGFKRADEGEKKEKVVCNINGHNVSNECRIKMSPNPKRVGSKAHERYAEYEHTTTVGEYLEAGGLKADLRFDQSKGYLELVDHIVGGKIEKVLKKSK
jgi:hypothetical protein